MGGYALRTGKKRIAPVQLPRYFVVNHVDQLREYCLSRQPKRGYGF
jgi:hypothetical protein